MSLNLSTQYRLENVRPGTQQTLKMLDSGKAFSVTGDGRLESYLMDEFHSATAVQSIEDPRVAAFAKEVLPKVEDRIAPEEGKQLVEKHFGPGWTFSQYRREVTASHKEGQAAMGVSVANYSDAPNRTTIWASLNTEDTTLFQSVTQSGLSPTPLEYLMWEPSKAATQKHVDKINEGLKKWAEDRG